MFPSDRQRSYAAFAAFTLALSVSAHAGVWVVDEFGGGDFLRIQPAVNAASDGDTILVKAGSYPGFEVIDKALTITAELAATVDVEGSARVFDLSASKTVVLAGLACVGVSGGGLNEYGFYAEDCTGSVRVERCTFLGADGTTGHRDGTDGARAVRCVDIAFSAIDSTGGRGLYAYWEGDPPPDPRGNGGMGLLVLDSNASVFTSTLRGGDGVEPPSPSNYQDSGGHGGDGLRVMSPTIPASATTLIGSECTGGNGADGGPSDGLLPSWGGDGGNGIRVESGLARVLGALTSGGVGGWGWWEFGMTHFPATDGAHGLGQAGDPGDFEAITGSPRALATVAPVREGDTLDLSFSGVPGDRVTLLVGLDARTQEYLPAWHATRLVQAPGSKAKSIRPIGVIPASGTLDVSLPVFDLGYGVEARTLHLQALFRTSANEIFASNAATPVELDAAY